LAKNHKKSDIFSHNSGTVCPISNLKKVISVTFSPLSNDMPHDINRENKVMGQSAFLLTSRLTAAKLQPGNHGNQKKIFFKEEG
jgi:hypothetical protein